MNTNGNVVIIGGGATGALTAVALAELGFQVVVLEKASIGNGSSSRSAACIRAQFETPETVIGMRYSEDWYVHFHERLKTPRDRAASPIIVQNGYLFLYEHPQQAEAGERDAARKAWETARRNVAMQQTLGLAVEILTPQDVAARWPHIAADPLIGATWCPSDGFLHHDAIYLEGFRRARELGVKVLEGTEVTGAVHGPNDRILAVRSTHGDIECDWFINATNAWAPRVSRTLGGMELRIDPLKRHLWILRADSQAIPPSLEGDLWQTLPMTIYGMSDRRGVYSRPEGRSHNLLIGHAHETRPDPEFTDQDQDVFQPGFSAKEGYESAPYAAWAQINDFAPALAAAVGAPMDATCGYYGQTPDGNPFIGIDRDVPNLVHAAGFSGHGLMHAPITAFLVARILCDPGITTVALPPPFDSLPMNLSRFDPTRDFEVSLHETMVI
jgi:FAD-dependent oxidoreductase domain-containing protein 1